MRALTVIFSFFMLAMIGLATLLVTVNVPGGQAEHIVPFMALAAVPFLVLLFRASWSSTSTIDQDSKVDEMIHELSQIQNRIEERVTNLETILLSRVHNGARGEKY